MEIQKTTTKLTSTQTSTIPSTITNNANTELILSAKENNFRKIVKSGHKEALHKKLQLSILILANCYTSVNFSNPLTKPEELLLNACANTVINQFPSLGLAELDLAFQLASTGKLNVSLKTFYGKFHVGILGEVLSSYLKFRDKVIGEQHKKSLKLIPVKTDKENSDNLVKKVLAQHKAISDYFLLKAELMDSGVEAVYSKIKSFWAKVLIKFDLIKFSPEEKEDIWNQSYKNVIKHLNNVLFSSNSTKRDIIQSKDILRKIKRNEYSEELEMKRITEYSKQLILKSMLM